MLKVRVSLLTIQVCLLEIITRWVGTSRSSRSLVVWIARHHLRWRELRRLLLTEGPVRLVSAIFALRGASMRLLTLVSIHIISWPGRRLAVGRWTTTNWTAWERLWLSTAHGTSTMCRRLLHGWLLTCGAIARESTRTSTVLWLQLRRGHTVVLLLVVASSHPVHRVLVGRWVTTIHGRLLVRWRWPAKSTCLVRRHATLAIIGRHSAHTLVG